MLRGVAVACKIHQDPPHQVGGDSVKLLPIVKLSGAVNQAKVGFMNQRRALQGVIHTLVPQVVARHTAQFAVNQRYQRIKRFFVASFPLAKQFCKLVGPGGRDMRLLPADRGSVAKLAPEDILISGASQSFEVTAVCLSEDSVLIFAVELRLGSIAES
jgi:hypothetical protein